MDLDDFVEFRISTLDGKNKIYLRHMNCPDRHVETIELEPPLSETNLKWLMLRATIHWQEAHQNEG